MADIVLRDRSGNPVQYPGVERVKLNTTDGGTVEFVDPALIPESVEKTIDPDFSGGNIVETPEAGTMFSKFTVNKPATLDPQYIAEGVNIAGIIGTLAAGGGGAKVAIGTVKLNTMPFDKTYNHNLGVIPDMIIFAPNAAVSNSTTSRMLLAWAISDKFNKANTSYPCGVSCYCSTKWSTYTKDTPMDLATGNGKNAIYNVTETQFTIATNNVDGLFIAIAGLT